MSFAIPRPALYLGLAGLIPFLAAALGAQIPALELEFAPPLLIIDLWGPVIFAYMSGVLWGFATGAKQTAGRPGWRWLGVAAAPALFLFLALFAAPEATVMILLIGFPALLIADLLFWRKKMTPPWWMTLRLLLTSIVTGSLYLVHTGAGFAL